METHRRAADGRRLFTTQFKQEQIARVVETALTAPRPSARYAPVPNKITNYFLLRALPKRWVDRIFVWRLGLDRPADRT